MTHRFYEDDLSRGDYPKWTQEDRLAQHRLTEEAVAAIYPQKPDTRRKASHPELYRTTRRTTESELGAGAEQFVTLYAHKHFDIDSYRRSNPHGAVFPDAAVAGALREMDIDEKHALFRQFLRGVISTRGLEHSQKLIMRQVFELGLSQHQKQLAQQYVERFRELLEEQIQEHARKRDYVNPQDVLDDINRIKQDAIERIGLMTGSYR